MALSFKEKQALQAQILTLKNLLKTTKFTLMRKIQTQNEITALIAQLRGVSTAAPVAPAAEVTPPPAPEVAKNSLRTGINAMVYLLQYMPKGEWQTVKDNMAGEEGQYFIDLAVNLVAFIKAMPITGTNRSDKALVYLHYFRGSTDCFITERDMEEDEQLQAYGFTILNGDLQNAEWGYISIPEITGAGLELDLHWKTRPMDAIKKEYGLDDDSEPTGKPTAEAETQFAVSEAEKLIVDMEAGLYNDKSPPQFIALAKQVSDALGVDRVKAATISYMEAYKPGGVQDSRA